MIRPKNQFLGSFFSKVYHSKINEDFCMKPKAVEAKNTKFSKYESSFLISIALLEKFKLESWPSVIRQIWGFADMGVHVKMKESMLVANRLEKEV